MRTTFIKTMFGVADDFLKANRIANLAIDTSTFDTTDSEAEEYTRGKRKRKRVRASSCESSDSAGSSPRFKRPLAVHMSTSKSSASKSVHAAAKRNLNYSDNSTTSASPTASSAAAATQVNTSPHDNHLTQSCATDAALPMAGSLHLLILPSLLAHDMCVVYQPVFEGSLVVSDSYSGLITL